jgi:site-specific DNA recombinase
MNEKIKAALYIRVSTDKQFNDGYGLEDQKKRLEQYCFAKNYEIYKIYCEGESAKDTIHRPQYNSMLADMERKKFSRILTIKLDRISRSTRDFYILLSTIKENNCGLEFIDTPLDLDGMSGKMMAGMLCVFAEFERDLIVDRTQRGVNEAVQNGHFGGKPPLGYTNKTSDGNMTKTWQINKEEAKIVKEIFQLCLNGNSYAQISNIMNKKYPNIIACYRIDKITGERIPIYRHWKDSSIYVILNNKRYIGIHEHRKTSKTKDTIEILGKIEPIITEETFYECQENIKKNSRNYYRNKNYLFMQKLKCPKCGRILACNGARKLNKKDYLYYKCSNCCIYVREEWIEKILIDSLIDMLELYLVLGGNYYPISNDLANDFNNCGINNEIRFSIDNRLINDKKNGIVRYDSIYPVWNNTPYETKCEFIREYVDTIEVKIRSNKGNKIPKIELVNLKLKPNKIKMLFDLKEKCMLDEIEDYGNYKCSISMFRSEIEALKYIDILKKKFELKTIQKISTDEDYYNYNDDLFKVINILPKKAIEKPKSIYLELCN